MQLTLPILLIAIGGLVLVTQRNRWAVLGALFIQWIGLALQISQMPAGTSGVLVEVIAALGCCGILGLTEWNVARPTREAKQKAGKRGATPRSRERRASVRNTQSVITDQFWLWATALVAGVAGFALAQIYPLGGSSQDLVTFYWLLLPAVLALVIDGPRDVVKQGASILSLFNAALLVVYMFGAGPPGVVLVGLAALGRLALAAIIAYAWLFFSASYPGSPFNVLFDLRDGKDKTETALALVPDATNPLASSEEIIEAEGDAE